MPGTVDRHNVSSQTAMWPTSARTMVWVPSVTANYSSRAVCPDRLTFHDLGGADNLRGRVVRGFFRLMSLWPVR